MKPNICKTRITQLSEALNTREKPKLKCGAEEFRFLCVWFHRFAVFGPCFLECPNTIPKYLWNTRECSHLILNVVRKTLNYFSVPLYMIWWCLDPVLPFLSNCPNASIPVQNKTGVTQSSDDLKLIFKYILLCLIWGM